MAKSLRAFNVFLPNATVPRFLAEMGRGWTHVHPAGDKLTLVDTIFYDHTDTITAEEVKASLINHDGYDYRIIVTEEK